MERNGRFKYINLTYMDLDLLGLIGLLILLGLLVSK